MTQAPATLFCYALCTGLLLCSGCRDPAENHAMDTTTQQHPNGGLTTPHPGRITHHYLWNNKDEIVDAATVPDEVKFVYYDAHGQDTSDMSAASYRVPIVRVDITSLDKEGKPVAPEHATHFFMSEIGPQHRELRHTTAAAPGK